MWNPSPADVAELVMLKRAHPLIAKHVDHLLDHLAVAARKVAFYEGIADAGTIAKAAEAGFAGMTTLEKAAFANRNTPPEVRLVSTDHQLARAATPAEREALAKRSPFTPAGAPLGKVVNAGGLIDSSVLAAVKGAPKTLPTGHALLNDLARRA